MIGNRFPEWQRLAKALGELAGETGASNAYVLDSVANLWCAGERYDGAEADEVMALAYEHLTKMPRPLKRGGRLDGAVGRAYMRSFATIYVLVLPFEATFELPFVRALVAWALPKIEALTLALPPPEGPGSGSAEGVGSA